jgi:hypothetical protein
MTDINPQKRRQMIVVFKEGDIIKLTMAPFMHKKIPINRADRNNRFSSDKLSSSAKM